MGRAFALLMGFVALLGVWQPVFAHAGHDEPAPPAAMPAIAASVSASATDAPNVTLPVRCPDDDGAPCCCHLDTLPSAPGEPLVAACRADPAFVLPPPSERPRPAQHPFAVPTDRVGSVSARGPPAL